MRTARGLLSADCDVYDAGVLADTASVFEHTFILNNNGPDTCRISRVERSCGCTVTELSSRFIPPGESIELKATTALAGLFDYIDKTVSVFFDDIDRPLVLHMVADKPRRAPTAMDYPYSPAGAARFSAHILFAGYVHHGEVGEATLNVFNNSNAPLRLHLKGQLPDRLKFKKFPSSIPPGALERITLGFDMRNAGSLYGEFVHKLTLADGLGNNIPLTAYAIVIDKKVPGQGPTSRIYAPVTARVILDSQKGEKMLVEEFSITNIGTAPLVIRDVRAPAIEGVTASVGDRLINSGKSTVLSVCIPGGTLPCQAEVGITSNDPVEPYKIFSVMP